MLLKEKNSDETAEEASRGSINSAKEATTHSLEQGPAEPSRNGADPGRRRVYALPLSVTLSLMCPPGWEHSGNGSVLLDITFYPEVSLPVISKHE